MMQSAAPLRKSIAGRRRMPDNEHVLVRVPADCERRLEVSAHPDMRHQPIVKREAFIVIADRQRDVAEARKFHRMSSRPVDSSGRRGRDFYIAPLADCAL